MELHIRLEYIRRKLSQTGQVWPLQIWRSPAVCLYVVVLVYLFSISSLLKMRENRVYEGLKNDKARDPEDAILR
jgi:hypothetical protein